MRVFIISTCFLWLLFKQPGVTADLPIHSVTASVKGLWSFKLGKRETHYPESCGGGVPNFNKENLELPKATSWLRKEAGGTGRTLEFFLSDNLVPVKGVQGPRHSWKTLAVTSSDEPSKTVGGWTMVYDEGFELVHAGFRFLGLLKYSRAEAADCPPVLNGDNENDFGETKCYVTDPTKTLIGWYSQDSVDKLGYNRKSWGCFYGEKINDSTIPTSFVLDKPKDITEIMTEELVHRHNSNGALWTAKLHPQFSNSTQYLLSRATKNFYRKIRTSPLYTLPNFKQQDTNFACPEPSTFIRSNSGIPKSFSWGDPFDMSNITEKPLNQGNCGSCYAVSSIYVLQKRFEILLSKLFGSDLNVFDVNPLSTQSIISCSMYNQGCDGGYPYLVGKHALDIGIPTASCMEYLATHDPSVASCKLKVGSARRGAQYETEGCSSEERWYAKDYGYVGGCYECSNESKIQQEILHNGPVVVALDAPDKLFSYSNGIFDSAPSEHGRFCDDPGKSLNGWEFTNHAVAIVGWGEQEGALPFEPRTKYWVVRNTWGPEWGQNGYFKMIRGKNLAAIESQAVFIDPDLSRGGARKFVEGLKHKPKEHRPSSLATAYLITG